MSETKPPAMHDYDWAAIRLVPDVVRGDACTVGIVLHARTAGYLGVRLHPDPASVCGDVDAELVARYFDALTAVARGGLEAGPIGLLPASERFHWMTATRSTALQPSPVHTGRAADPRAALDSIYTDLVSSATGSGRDEGTS
jgi:hypothetical protein